LPLFAAASTFALAAGALAALGIACAGMNTASNALSSDLFPDERGRRMNGIALVVSLGGLAMPMATALGSGDVSWRTLVVVGAGLSACVAMAGMLVASPNADTGRGSRDPGFDEDAGATSATGAVGNYLRQPGFAWFCLLLMLGAASEASMAGWTSTFLEATGFSTDAATWALSSHWFGLIVGRVAFSSLVDRGKGLAIVRAASCGALFMLLFVAVRLDAVRAAAPFAIGVAIALIVPTSLALAGDRYRGNAGTLYGILLTLAQVGGILMPALIGLVADRAGVRAGLSLVVVNCALVGLVAHRAGKT
jgi:fucose permease